MTRPGLTRATQNSGVPLPLPIRTSVGFFETGTSGNTRIHTRPERFICRVIARRAASIWRAVIRAGSCAFSPKVPKLKATALEAAPLMRPLWALRYFVRFGCSMIVEPYPTPALKPKPERARGALASGRLLGLQAPAVLAPSDRAP